MKNDVIMLDFLKLKKEIKEKASEYLDEVTEENLNDFIRAAKFIAQEVLENYFFSIEDHYKSGADKIGNEKISNDFFDFHDGYRSLMKRWMKEHELEIKHTLNPTTLNVPCVENVNPRNTLIVAGVGTVVAVGLLIFSKAWIAIATEIIALSATACVYKQQKLNKKTEYDAKIKQYEHQLENEKTQFVDRVIEDLTKWLKSAESYSNELLATFKVL